jgi:glucose/arabinose dehydrogenase
MKRKHILPAIWLVITVILLVSCAADGGAGSEAGFGNETPQVVDLIKLTIEGASFPTLLDGPVFATPTATGTVTPVPPPTSTPIPRPTVAMSILKVTKPEELPLAAEVDIVLDEMHAPVAIAIAPDGRLFFTEKDTGHVRVAIDGVIQPDPVITLPVGSHGEQGMLGIVLDPDYETNHHIWISHTLPARANEGVKVNRVVRFTERDNIATDVQVAFESPNSDGDGTHNLNNMVFAPDGMIYVTIGDDSQAFLSQNLEDRRGKIHRFIPTIPLTAPDDNPFYDGNGSNVDSVYVYGVRNSFDFVLDPLSEEIRFFATENGPECDDEVNLILPGYNYGWSSQYSCEDPDRMRPDINTIPPMLVWDETNSPTGITVYTGDDFPEWYGDVFFCTYDGVLHHLKLNEARDAFRTHNSIPGLFCQTDVLNGPDGSLYFLEGGGYFDGTLKRIYNKNRQ